MQIHDYSQLTTLIPTQGFQFKNVVNKLFKCEVHEKKLKAIYNPQNPNKNNQIHGKGTRETKKIGVYALIYKGMLMKIGQAADDSDGIFHRMSQYYRGKDARCVHIDASNRDDVTVLYFNLEKAEECWAAEKLLQGIAYFCGEMMPWEEKKRKTKHKK